MTQIKRPEKTEDGFTIVYDPVDIPDFGSEQEEARFWDTHTWSGELLDEAAKAPRDPDLPPARSKTLSRATSLRLGQSTLTRLKTLARKKGLPYQTLLKSFVLERLYEEEKREGILPSSSAPNEPSG